MPESCAPGLSFDHYEQLAIPAPNEVFNIYIDELKDYLMIGSNGSADPICIDLNNNNEIVYLNHDNYFERIYMTLFGTSCDRTFYRFTFNYAHLQMQGISSIKSVRATSLHFCTKINQ
ncbi:hypothetical protein A4D02_27595 [Niastella koreensis]|nr:hypothetical protein A4D02_27595 [Niastella koreensis]